MNELPIEVAYLYACGFQESYKHLMRCKFEDDAGNYDIVPATYRSDSLLTCENPGRNWVHDAQLSIALNSQDFTLVR